MIALYSKTPVRYDLETGRYQRSVKTKIFSGLNRMSDLQKVAAIAARDESDNSLELTINTLPAPLMWQHMSAQRVFHLCGASFIQDDIDHSSTDHEIWEAAYDLFCETPSFEECIIHNPTPAVLRSTLRHAHEMFPESTRVEWSGNKYNLPKLASMGII